MRNSTQTACVSNGTSQPRQELPWLPILMYHRVVERVETPDPYNLCISRAEFESQMRYLAHQGYQAVALEDAARSLAAGGMPGRRQVVITFDDGYEEVYTNAFPVLEELGLKASVMLVGSCLGGVNTWDNGKARKTSLLNVSRAREMLKHGISMGSHGMTHCRLTEVSPGQAMKEIADSRALLEDILGCEVTTFSFPYGNSSPAIRDMVRTAGYVAACGIEQREHSLFNLSRIDASLCRGNPLRWRLELTGIIHRCRQNRLLRRLRAIGPARRPGSRSVF